MRWIWRCIGSALRRSARIDARVIVVGNITAGGSGKTPLVIALVEALRARGMRPAIVSRGYGGSQRPPAFSTTRPIRAATATNPAWCAGARAHRSRSVAIESQAAALLVRQGADVVIADDGSAESLARARYRNLRHRRTTPLRQRTIAAGRALAGVARSAEQRRFPHLQRRPRRIRGDCDAAGGEMAVAVADAMRTRPLSSFVRKRVHAIAGIGNPARFFAGLQARGIEVIAHAFPDHHAFVAADLEFGDGLPMLMTEKDAIKCVTFAHRRMSGASR